MLHIPPIFNLNSKLPTKSYFSRSLSDMNYRPALLVPLYLFSFSSRFVLHVMQCQLMMSSQVYNVMTQKTEASAFHRKENECSSNYDLQFNQVNFHEQRNRMTRDQNNPLHSRTCWLAILRCNKSFIMAVFHLVKQVHHAFEL